MKHYFRMLIGCTLPLLLIFVAPLLNVSKDVSLLIFMLAMFACHLLIPVHHPAENQQRKEKDKDHASSAH